MFELRRSDGDYHRLACPATDIHPRTSDDEGDNEDEDEDDEDDSVFHAVDLEERFHSKAAISIPTIATNILHWRTVRPLHKRRSRHPVRHFRLLVRCAAATLAILFALILLTPIIVPSYTYRPDHYTGSNPSNEKVFIAANIVDEGLIRGAWGERVLELIDIIGPQNTFLSIYENDSGVGTKAALHELSQKVKCNSSIISGYINLDTFPSVQILPNHQHHRRIQYLAEVRNRALRPLDGSFDFNITTIDDPQLTSYNTSSLPTFDKLLFLNDIVFSAADAADLLFATNLNPHTGRTDYHAACAMDFVNPFKFYDMFALRDTEGYKPGLPFFPFFSTRGLGLSRSAVLAQSDAVPVKSCWGGMAAFEASWFMPNPNRPDTRPLRFRAEQELFWESSECCLIHADLDYAVTHTQSPFQQPQQHNHDPYDRGIYVNPYIRVAYTARTQAWLAFARRFERLYPFPHWVANTVARLPSRQLRRPEEPDDTVNHKEWTYDGPELPLAANQTVTVEEVGHWKDIPRIAKPGGFCGTRSLLVLKDHWEEGERMWEKIPSPKGGG